MEDLQAAEQGMRMRHRLRRQCWRTQQASSWAPSTSSPIASAGARRNATPHPPQLNSSGLDHYKDGRAVQRIPCHSLQSLTLPWPSLHFPDTFLRLSFDWGSKGQSKEAYQRDASRTSQGWCGRTREGRHTMLLPLQILFSTGFPSVSLRHLQPSWVVAPATAGHQLSL